MPSRGPAHRVQPPPLPEAPFEQAVLAAALDPIVTIGPQGTILSASDSIERVFGWTVADLVGRNVRVLMPEPHRSAHDGYLARYAATGRTGIMGRPRQFEAVRRNGSRFPIELCVSRADIPGRGEPVFVGIIRDLTEQKQTEAELARHRERLEQIIAERTEELDTSHEQLRMADRLASIGTLAAGLGHDMNNVLLPVRARLNALRAEGSLSASAHNHLDEIRKSIAYLQQLADGLHYLAMDPQRVNESQASTDLSAWWAQVGALLSKSVPKHARVTARFDLNLPPVAVPAHSLTQAVLNLTVNAGEAIPADRQRREGRVRIAAALDSADPSLVRVTVADNGIGMSEVVRRRAAEIFFTTKPRGLGTGLGLALVHNVVAGAGGRLEIQSTPGKGTTISLVLPAAPVAGRETPPLRAAVSLSDGRAAAMVHHVLDTLGIRATDTSTTDADVWITDPQATQPEQARAWTAARPGAPLILLGHPGAAWEGFHAVTIVPPDDLDAIRAAIGAALAS